MDLVADILINYFFYWTGRIFLPILSFGRLKAEPIDRGDRGKWKMGVFIHKREGENHLESQWVAILGLIFWVFSLIIVFKFII